MSTLEVTDERLKILDHLPVGIFIINKDYTVIFWNACIEKWTDIPGSEISGADFTSHFPCFKEPRYQSRIANVLNGTAPTFFSPQLHRNILRSSLPNGEPRVQRIEVIPVRSFDGNDTCALFVVEDVTELTNRISELNKAKNELQETNNDIIVHKHNGKLLVESEAGKGTKFTVKLPITEKEPIDRKEIESNGQKNSTICG